MRKTLCILMLLALSACLTGCEDQSLFSASTWDPLGLRWRVLPHEEPLRVGLCFEYQGIFDVTNWGRFPPWYRLRMRLEERFQRPVEIQNLNPFQVAMHLTEQEGELDFALLGADDYTTMLDGGEPVGHILAVADARERQGVIVAAASSDIESLADLRGRRFAFGPKNDPVLHVGTITYLESQGIQQSEIKGLLPSTLEHHISSYESAKDVAYMPGVDAGVMETSEFEALPETGGRWFPPPATFSKDQFRELGRTEIVRVETMQEGPFLAAERLDPELVEKMHDFLLTLDQEDPKALYDLGFDRFREPGENPSAEIQQMAAAGRR